MHNKNSRVERNLIKNKNNENVTMLMLLPPHRQHQHHRSGRTNERYFEVNSTKQIAVVY